MPIMTAIAGKAGTGKTTSLRNINPNESVLIRPFSKGLPFKNKGWRTEKTKEGGANLLTIKSSKQIVELYDRLADAKHIKNIIIDDYQYYGGGKMIEKIMIKNFDKFNEVAKVQADIITNAADKLREDQVFIITTHIEEENNNDGTTTRKFKTFGKAVDRMLSLEGYFNTVLFTDIITEDKKLRHIFRTQGDGTTVAKSPMGLFDPEEYVVDNDMQVVIEKLRAYNGLV